MAAPSPPAGGGGGGPMTSSSSTRNVNVSVTNINCGEMDLSTTGSVVAAGASHLVPAPSTTPLDATLAAMNGKLYNTHPPFNSANASLGPGGSIRISVPKIEESEDEDGEVDHPELSKIVDTSCVNMRQTHNKTENKEDEENNPSSHHNNNNHNNIPRPMSWEGELSDQEDGDTSSTLLERIATTEDQDEDSNMDVDGAASMPSSEKTTISGVDLKTNPSTATFGEPPAIVALPIKREKNETTISVKPEFLERNLLLAKSIIQQQQQQQQSPSSIPNNLKYEQQQQLELSQSLSLSHHRNKNTNSPLLVRSKSNLLPANPSPDSAIHSVYTHSSPSQSPLTSRHNIYTPSLSRNNSDASHSSCYSYSSEFSPTHSPIQSRHLNGLVYGGGAQGSAMLYRPMMEAAASVNNGGLATLASGGVDLMTDQLSMTESDQLAASTAGISRQQLINSPCPICGDKISGFHYGIFSCESCKGFFKRTVQNRKNYVCVRGAACPVTIATRKKCPACRFEKCLQRGMKLEAIREDRTRGGRSTYQCSFTLPGSMLSPESTGGSAGGSPAGYYQSYRLAQNGHSSGHASHNGMCGNGPGTPPIGGGGVGVKKEETGAPVVPILLKEIMDVEHLWQMNEAELTRLNQPNAAGNSAAVNLSTNPLLASAGIDQTNSNPDMIANLCNIADHRLYKIVKWCKSLPLFKHISIDDQICLLINSWCELLLFSCCYRSVATPGEIRISCGKSITLAQAKSSGMQTCIERMLNLTDHMRRLRLDRYEYVAMKVIVLLQSDTSELKEPEKVRTSQEKALHALQSYTLSHYPGTPAKFGELLLRIPELQRTCQVGKEMLTIRSREGEEFNLLMELLRGEH